MIERKVWLAALTGALLLIGGPLWGTEISVEGGPMETGFNSGAFAYIHATVHGLTGQPKRYVVFAEIQYYGTTSNTSVEMDRLPETKPGVEEFQVGWPIPPQAPTGLYTLTLHVDDRIEHSPEVTKKVHGFVVYKKLVRISRVTLDKTIYDTGEPIKCEVGLENLSDADVKGLRVEFSNANYPWISLYSQEGHENPDLAIRMLREHLDIPAGTAVTIPMMTAGTATFLRGKQRDVMGSGMALGDEKIPPPEIDTYTVALWNADRTKLYDMQFTPPAILRTPDRNLPKPYSRNFTHPYNSYIDFTKYREFYAPGQISAALEVDPSHTLYRPGDTVKIIATLKNPGEEVWNGATFQARLMDLRGKVVYSGTLASGISLASGVAQKVAADTWTIPSTATPGTYPLELTLAGTDGKLLAHIATEIAVNELPASLLVICAHEDDEQAYSGLIRAAVEAKIPVQVLILTAGDVGECERYFDKPCGPNEAREFGTVRLEESAEALEHLGLPRDKLIDLGLPDGGSGAIWFDHKDSSNPFLSIYLACDHAPYEKVYKPNLPYARDAVVEAIRQIIANFHPAMIALTGPDERHVDHRTANWFAIKACQELLKAKGLDPQTVVLADQTYGAGGFKPAPYKYENFVVHLSGEAAARKQEAAWVYQSQDGNLAEGERKTLAELPREEKHLRILDWQEHEGWNEAGRN
ncbi:MAG TPA: PIG-L family deacetylase [Terriglobia bacterium]|nr:PIG-L family deacetylase [Terriglobia bacterium]